MFSLCSRTKERQHKKYRYKQLTPVLHKDETGLRIGGKLHWLHVLCDSRHTLYLAHKKRGNDADREMNVLPAYSGTLVHPQILHRLSP